ncbi:dienelactone hydrolase family protein [Streptomyces sp. LP05-1]|uniref:Dienelactone hydrolase family protein n=1 Tax=Streptomyces pyxinae TaxID=2970734 RepID=A0ABT2CQW3_9ACTN|nr:dienelactone hydrolase family protein [Streptomyces sp. LP05-1]MCS0639808.1 dienelactone hydrolase family protein [Streptomyces sp. LP05-1]
MAHSAVFHSVLGLRPPGLLLSDRLRRAGHVVVAPDLFGGEAAPDLDHGFRLLERVGRPTVMQRAQRAMDGMPADTALIGVSMGTGVVAGVWSERPATAKVLLVHAAADVPGDARPGVRIQLHAADPDLFTPPKRVASLTRTAQEVGAGLQAFRYPGVGHFYTDPAVPDHDLTAAELTWRRTRKFLDEEQPGSPLNHR